MNHTIIIGDAFFIGSIYFAVCQIKKERLVSTATQMEDLYDKGKVVGYMRSITDIRQVLINKQKDGASFNYDSAHVLLDSLFDSDIEKSTSSITSSTQSKL